MKKLKRFGCFWKDENGKNYVWNDEEKFENENGKMYEIIERINDDEVIVK